MDKITYDELFDLTMKKGKEFYPLMNKDIVYMTIINKANRLWFESLIELINERLEIKDNKIKLIIQLLAGIGLTPGVSEEESNRYRKIYEELQEMIKEE